MNVADNGSRGSGRSKSSIVLENRNRTQNPENQNEWNQRNPWKPWNPL